MPSKMYPVRVADGARLVTALSLENVGERNWSRKLNFRRFKDQEIRQEGWQKFFGATQYVFDGTESVLRLAELVRPNGDRVIVGASRTKIKKYDTGTALWTDITGGLTFSASGKRWQWCTINGYLVLNNAVDLPVSYRVEDAAVSQIKELRQVGYARIGRICEYNGFLQIADLTKIKAEQLDTWMNGYASYTTTSTIAKAADWTIVFPTDHRTLFNVTTGASTITVTLPPLTFSNRPIYFWITKVDAGAGTVVTSPAIVDEAVVLTANGDSALVWWNGQKWVAKVFAGGVIPATDPYGTPPTSITERYPWAVSNGEFGEPTRWAPSFSALMSAASTTVVLPFPPSTWTAKTTRVGVINGGPDGDILGGQTGYEDGVLITAISTFDPVTMGVAITLEVTTDAALTYPRLVNVTRWTDISTIVAEYRLVGDSSEIIGMLALGEFLILYRTTCIYIGRYTGDATNPFIFTSRYPGKESINLPIWGDAIADINGDYHLYPGVGGRFYKFDGVSWPTIHEVCDDAKELFFNGVVTTDEVFAVANPYTKQIWFCRPTLTFAYDFEFGTVSEIDAVVGAGAFVQKPGASDKWFILAIGRFVYTYGLVTNGATNIQTYLRDGVAPSAVLKSGLISANNLSGEKDIFSYCPVLSSSSPDAELQIQLYGTYNPNVAPTALMVPAQDLPTPAGENFFTTAYRAMFFQDSITVTDTADVDVRVSERIFEFDGVGSGQGIPRRVTS
jgi:hypothetical protein